MNILENMLHIETEARKIVEGAQDKANTIRKKAREDAKNLVAEGKLTARNTLKQEIAQLEKDADVQRTRILTEAQQRRSELKQKAGKQIDKAVEMVMELLLNEKDGSGDS